MSAKFDMDESWRQDEEEHRRLKTGVERILGSMLLIGIVAFAGTWPISGRSDDRLIGQRIACDNAIEAVMTSRDAIEIERGGVTLKALGCDVGRRIGPDGRFNPDR
jgi:hypothetical protein